MTLTATIGAPAAAEDVFFYPANLYVVQELARRAGVSRSTFETWKLEGDASGYLSVYIQPGTNRRVRFPQVAPDFWKKIQPARCRTATATWMKPLAARCGGVADFKIPFSRVEQESVGPLFVAESSQSIRCTVDLLTSLLLVLSRFEETLDVPRDEHGRFSAFSSLAWREGFLHRPIVDEWGLAFAEAIQYLLPVWKPKKKPPKEF